MTSHAEYRRQYQRDLTHLITDAESLRERAASLRKHLAGDLRGSEDAGARIFAAAEALGTAAWLLRGAKRVVP